MKGQNFLLGFLGKQEPTTIKGKNPNPNSKLIKEKPLVIEKKQVEQKSLRSSQKDFKKVKNPSVVNEIQKLQKRLQATNQQISQTQKKLDVDLFLKQQKQKRQQYAKDINKQYQIQKKKREQKLYKKYNRGNQQENNQEGEKGQIQNLQQTKNVKTPFPLELIKILQTEGNSISKSESIVGNHHFSLDNVESQGKMISYQKMSEEEIELLFKKSTENKENSTVLSVMPLRKIAQNMLNLTYFPINFSQSTLEPTEEYQNLMNVLTLMPEHLQLKYYSSKVINENNYFLCRMFYNGQRKSIITTDLIETRQFAHYHINLHSKMTDNRSFGPTIVEKCYRKVSSNFKYPDLASSVYALYGTDVEIISIGNRNYIKENFQVVIKWLVNSKQLIGFMNCEGHNERIYENRVYQLNEILDTVELSEQQLGEKTKKKKGQIQPIQQEKNTEKFKKTLYHFSNPYKGLVLDTKGINKFQLLQVLQKFNKLILIRDYPRNWSCKRINLELFSLGPLSMTSNEWTKNNQYNFTLTTATNIRIVMRKLLSSNAEAIINRQVAKQEDFQTNSVYGFMVFQCKQGEEKITCMKLDSLLVKTKSNDSLEYPSFITKFDKGSYIIIPYSNKVTKTSYQFFNLDFFIQKEDNLKFGKAVINQWKWTKQQNNISHSQKIIQSLQSKQYIQRIKTQDIEINRISPSYVNPQKLLNGIEKDKLIVPKQFVVSDLLIPGKLTNFLINPEMEATTKNNKSNNKSKPTQKDPQKQVLSNNNKSDEIQSLQREQALQILLGYDLLQGEQVNRGLMMEEMQNNEEVFDFEHYGLGNEYFFVIIYSGLTAIMQTLMGYPCIRKLNLADNDLDDSAMVYLCYYLDKGNRVELKELDVSGNSFGKIGMDSIKGLMARFEKLHITY